MAMRADKTKKGKTGAGKAREAAHPGETVPGEGQKSWQTLIPAGISDRVDKFLAGQANLFSRSQLKARNARIFINGREEKAGKRLKPGDRLLVIWDEEPEHSYKPENLAVSIIFENDDVFVFDKVQGMVVHPANGNWSGTLANAVLGLEMSRRGEAHLERGGIVHRLDKDTSGVIIVARNSEAHAFLAGQFKERTTRKEYFALTHGIPKVLEGRIENYLARDKKNRKKFAAQEEGGKHALTIYRTVAVWEAGKDRQYALVQLFPKTGRTHQLRVHLAGMGCPIVGDPIYGVKENFIPDATLMLHARRLKIRLPGEETARIFKAPFPAHFIKAVRFLDARAKKISHPGGRQDGSLNT